NYCILVSTFLSIKTISSSYIASEKGSIAKENLYLLKGVSSPVQCTLRCNQRKEAAFYGAGGTCGCFSREDLSSDSQTEISGYNHFEIRHTKALYIPEDTPRQNEFSMAELDLVQYPEGKIVNIIPQTTHAFELNFKIQYHQKVEHQTQVLEFTDGYGVHKGPQITMKGDWITFNYRDLNSKKVLLQPDTTYNVTIRQYKTGEGEKGRLRILINKVQKFPSFPLGNVPRYMNIKCLIGDPFKKLPSTPAVVTDLNYTTTPVYFGIGTQIFLPEHYTVESIDNWPPPNWQVKLGIKLVGNTGWADAFYLAKPAAGDFGGRIPNIQFSPTNKMHIWSHIGTSTQIVYKQVLPLNQWFDIKIEQKLRGGNYYVLVFKDGVKVAEVLHMGYTVISGQVKVSFEKSYGKIVMRDFDYGIV
uniref:Uncharacterized protein n=1 Tax=Clytia hemisphaerica TaxID=252671 RepID=A0A7M5WZZ5_9CNID